VRRAWIIAVIGCGLVVCAANCRTGGASASKPAALSARSEVLPECPTAPLVESLFGGVVRDEAAERRMQRVAECLYGVVPEFGGRLQFRLLAADRPNALSLPGRVYITTGLYRHLSSDERVAAVVAHEIAHILANDHFKPHCSGLDVLERESAADLRGAEILRDAGLEPGAMVEVVLLVRECQPYGWTDARIRALERGVGR
jgi:predicted Zn-dependent protease